MIFKKKYVGVVDRLCILYFNHYGKYCVFFLCIKNDVKFKSSNDFQRFMKLKN
jgi:hypothetical protein